MPITEEKEKKRGLNVEFVLKAPEARNIFLLGDFNRWDPETPPMKPDEKGLWRLRISIPPGRYEYKLLIDGKWCLDGNNPHRVTNPFGTENNVLLISEK